MNRITVFILLLIFSFPVMGQAVWEIPQRRTTIQVDGFLHEWDEIAGMLLQAGAPGIQAASVSEAEDVTVMAKAVWDSENLYLALEWKDDIWDTEQVLRHQAVWVTPDRKRRERMLFYDFLKFQMFDVDFDYLLWVAPRIDNRGPFSWVRLLSGAKRMERATSAPAISCRQENGRATLEILFFWKQLRTEAKEGKIFPLTLLVADSDLPGKPLELKIRQLKSLLWEGGLKLAP